MEENKEQRNDANDIQNKKMSQEEFLEYAQKFKSGEYFIGAHGSKGDEELVNKIMHEGLSLKTEGNAYGMPGTVTSFGHIGDWQNLEDATNYSYDKNGIIILAPIALENEKGEAFIGYPERTPEGYPKDQEDFSCLMSDICEKIGKVPECFILGYYIRDENGNRSFVLNENHYSNLSKEKKQEFYDAIMEKQSKDTLAEIKNFTEPYELSKMYEVKQRYEEAGLNFSQGKARAMEQLSGYKDRKDRKEKNALLEMYEALVKSLEEEKEPRANENGIIPNRDIVETLTQDVTTKGINQQVNDIKGLTREKEQEEQSIE